MKKHENTEIIKEYKKKYCGVIRQYTILAGRIIVRYKSRIIINGKLKTKYYKYIGEAENHYKSELIKAGRTIKKYKMRKRNK